MGEFIVYCEEEEGLTLENLRAVQAVMQDFVESDIPLAIELLFVEESEIQKLNREMRDTDKVTDVLSFPALDGIKGKAIHKKDYPYEIDEEGNLLIGSIVICCQRAKEQAQEYGHSYNRELHYLLIHGILHCLGYDHMIDADKEEMREKEELLLGKLGIRRI